MYSTQIKVTGTGRFDKVPAWKHATDIVSEYNSGKHIIELGDKYNCANNTIRNILKSNNVTLRGYQKTDYSDPDAMRRCYVCKKIKPFSEFTKCRSFVSVGGRDYKCRECNRKKAEHYLHKKLTMIYRVSVSQEDKCEICGIMHKDVPRGLFIDHDHSTGKYRGKLCMYCNGILGMAKDNIENLTKAISYLEHHKSL